MATRKSVQRSILVPVALVAATALLVLAVAVTTARGGGSDVRVLPTELLGPPPLEPGTYQTRPRFDPPTAFTVGQGWYGGQGGHTSWCVGKGYKGFNHRFDEGEGLFRVAAICGFRTWLPYATAVSRFKSLKTLDAGSAKPIQMGGYRGVSFHAVVQGELAATRGLPLTTTLARVPSGTRPGDEQIFLNVRGKTVLLQVELFARPEGEAASREFLRTVRFPR
jgi:hypothetical protein